MGQKRGVFWIYTISTLISLPACQYPEELYFVPPPSSPYCETHYCPNIGHIEGRLCSYTHGHWMEGVEVSIALENETLREHTDATGFFRFSSVPTGAHTVQVHNHPTVTSYDVFLYRGHTVHLGPNHCDVSFGELKGRACGPTGRWLTQASVSIEVGDDILETQTNQNGYFYLEQIPVGSHSVKIEQGAFQTSFHTIIEENTLTTVPQPICIPHTTKMAVVTGVFDQVQLVLLELGYSIRNHYTDRNVEITYPQDSEGTVDLVNGSNSDYWLSDFLSDPVWMSEYDIILLNCGSTDSLLRNDNPIRENAIENLRNFVNNGGSIYSSDWASDIIRSAFPNRINFLGNDNEFGHSRLGMETPLQSAQILDWGLMLNLGQTTVELNLNLPLWSVVEPATLQPDNLRILVQGNVFHYDPSDYSLVHDDLEIIHSPLIVQFEYGAGRVLYTAAHTESQTTYDLKRVLDHIIFEL